MDIVLVTGSGGLVGAQAVRFFADKGFLPVGVDNDMRSRFFGDQASTAWAVQRLRDELGQYRHHDLDIRDRTGMERLFREYGSDIRLVVHTAAQPSHDWAAQDPLTDFSVNATGTLVMLENLRRHAPEATFIFTSTNKVYGDQPNLLPLVEGETRWELDSGHPFARHGIDESMPIDNTLHSVFGASKVAADVMVQEYGRYFGLKTGVFRGGCLTGPGHSGAMLHGFLAYLMKCAISREPYTVLGYKGKQVRDNIHSWDLVNMFWHFHQAPRPGQVYNAGGSRFSCCSMQEAIALCEKITGNRLAVTYSEQNRVGDHIWWISDVRKFQAHYPDWSYRYSLEDTLLEMHREMQARS